jgi:two-component system chemotaxis response regulator CheY
MHSIVKPVLIVDDYPVTLRIVRTLLRRLGFSVIDEAADARTALTKMQATSYALVISDCRMKPMSGLEFLRHARAHEMMRDTPFLMLANDSAEQIAAAQHASHAIMKPFSADALRASLTPVFGAL